MDLPLQEGLSTIVEEQRPDQMDYLLRPIEPNQEMPAALQSLQTQYSSNSKYWLHRDRQDYSPDFHLLASILEKAYLKSLEPDLLHLQESRKHQIRS